MELKTEFWYKSFEIMCIRFFVKFTESVHYLKQNLHGFQNDFLQLKIKLICGGRESVAVSVYQFLNKLCMLHYPA